MAAVLLTHNDRHSLFSYYYTKKVATNARIA